MMICTAARLRCLVMALGAAAIVSSASAEVEVRTYDKSDAVQPGETRFRRTEPGEPSPYVSTSPFAISFAPLLEVPCKSWDIVLLRLNILVGCHRAVYALDIGGLGNFADYKMDGIGVAGLFNSVGESDGAIHIAGIFNFAAFDFSGCQISGLYSCTEGEHCGLQVGVGNYAGRICGVQIGGFNYAEKGSGLQIGLWNCAQSLEGVQIGAINVNSESTVRFLPVVNAAF